MNLHGQIINLTQRPGLPMVNATEAQLLAYKIGHRDARHAAAELALRADAITEAARQVLALSPDDSITDWNVALRTLQEAVGAA